MAELTRSDITTIPPSMDTAYSAPLHILQNQQDQTQIQAGGSKKVRPSPSASATLYKVGTKKTGNDKNKWVVQENKAGVKRWVLFKKVSKSQPKAKAKSKSKSAIKFYDVANVSPATLTKVINRSPPAVQSLMRNLQYLISEIKKDRNCFIVPLPLSEGGQYWASYPQDYIVQYFKADLFNEPYIYFIIYMDADGKTINTNRHIIANFSEMDKKQKLRMFELLDEYVSYDWNGSNIQTIAIKWKAKSAKSKSKPSKPHKVHSNDVYPLMLIKIYFDKQTDMFKDKQLRSSILDELKKIVKKEAGKLQTDYDVGMHDLGLIVYKIKDKHFKKVESKIKKYLKHSKFEKSVTKVRFELDKGPK